MRTIDKIFITIIVVMVLGLWVYIAHLQNQRVEEYSKRCDKVGWDVCEREYYETHYENGMPK